MPTKVLTIRHAVHADISAIDALLAQSYTRLLKHAYPPSTRVTAIPLIARANPRLILGGTYLVATDGEGAIVAAGGWTLHGRTRQTAEIRHVVTDHRRVREGIGSCLMDTVLAKARAGGAISALCLSTRNAVPFYAANGFDVEEPVTVHLRAGITFDAVRMTRRL